MAFKQVKKSELFEGVTGLLAEVADRAMAAGFRYFRVHGKIFEVENGRPEGSSLGLHSLKGAMVVD